MEKHTVLASVISFSAAGGAALWHPPPRQFIPLVEGCLEYRRSQCGPDVECRSAGISETVPASGRNDHRLTSRHRRTFLFDPDFGLSF